MAVKTTSCFPHAGGDVSALAGALVALPVFSPRRWGCFVSQLSACSDLEVFPTQVGMFPETGFSSVPIVGFPHAGGDVSTSRTRRRRAAWFSPRRWGCFSIMRSASSSDLVFPTQVGMFPWDRKPRRNVARFPHAGGDVSPSWSIFNVRLKFSPRRWGCFYLKSLGISSPYVFPTQVGMFPTSSLGSRVCGRFPHAGGDVSSSGTVR